MKIHTFYYQTANLRIYPSLGQVQLQLESIRLGPINMQVLVTLLDRQGQVVSRNELFEQVWKNQIVSDDTLTRCISDLRALLGHHQTDVPLIQTLPKRGYRWLHDVQVIQEAKEDNLTIAPTIKDDVSTITGLMPVVEIASKITKEEIAFLPTKAQKKILDSKTKHFSWQSVMQWGTISLMILLIMTYTAIWIARNTDQAHYISVALLPIQISNSNLESIGIEIDHNLKQQILASKHLRYLSQRVIHKQSLYDIADISHHSDAKWIIESQISQQNQFLRVSFSLVDSNSSLVLYEKTRNFRSEKNKLMKLEELDVFSKEFVFQAEQLLNNN